MHRRCKGYKVVAYGEGVKLPSLRSGNPVTFGEGEGVN